MVENEGIHVNVAHTVFDGNANLNQKSIIDMLCKLENDFILKLGTGYFIALHYKTLFNVTSDLLSNS